MSLTARGFQFFLHLQLGDTFQFFYFLVIFTGVIREEKGGNRGKKKMEERQEEREKEGGELEERTEERTEGRTEEGTEEREERIEDREEGLEVTEEACEEDERCEEESECHSAAKRARVCATFTDSQENAIVEFVKEHPELYDKDHGCCHDRQRNEALWTDISAELKLQLFDVRRWFESQRTQSSSSPSYSLDKPQRS